MKMRCFEKKLGFRCAQKCYEPFFRFTFRDWIRLILSGKKKYAFTPQAAAKYVKASLGDHIWNDYFKFSFERTPFDRAISRYYWKTREKDEGRDINEYIQSNSKYQLSNWDKYTIDDRVALDFFGRYENPVPDLRTITDRLGLPELVLPNAKGNARKNRDDYSRVLNEVSRSHIEKCCVQEMQYFGYSWAGNNL